MSIITDSLTIFKREMLIFRSNIAQNIVKSVMFPFLLLLIFGNLGSGVSNVPVAIVNYANNQQSMQFISKLETHNLVLIKAITSESKAFSMFRKGSVDMVVVILPQFPNMHSQNPSIDIYYTNSQFTSLSVLPFIENTARSFGTSTENLEGIGKIVNPAAPQGNHKSLTKRIKFAAMPSQGVKAIPSFAAEGNYTTFLVAGVVIMVVAFGAMFSGGMSIITDRITGNLKMFLASPINRLAIIFGKILSGSAQSLLAVVLTILIGFLFGAQIAMGWYGVFWILLLALLTSIGIGGLATALAARIKKLEIYTIATQSIILPLWFVAGAFFPTSSLPSWLYPLSIVDPFTYTIQGIRYVMMSGFYPTGAMILDIGVSLLFAVAMIALSIKMLKKTIE